MTYGSITYHVVLINNLWTNRWNNSHPSIGCFSLTHVGTFNNNAPNYVVPSWLLHCYMYLQLNAKVRQDYAMIFYALIVSSHIPTQPTLPNPPMVYKFDSLNSLTIRPRTHVAKHHNPHDLFPQIAITYIFFLVFNKHKLKKNKIPIFPT